MMMSNLFYTLGVIYLTIQFIKLFKKFMGRKEVKK
jgi:hypothetical protein